MGSKGAATREKILQSAEQIILRKGFTATSIEDIITASFVTKSGFFYHFDGKSDLAAGLVERYLSDDDRIFTGMFERAESLSEDPLQQYLIFLKLLAEMMADLPNGHPGCLVASFTYESMQLEPEVLKRIADGLLSWRSLFGEHLQRVADVYPMKIPMRSEDMADMLTSVMEGGIVTSLTLNEPDILVRQILQYRDFIRLQFGDV